MSRFHALTVTDIHRTTRDAVVVTLQPDDPGAFAFRAGQHLTFRRDFGGTELRRSYSICAAPSEGTIRVGIRQVEGGVFSTWANEEMTPGERLDALPPSGAFTLEPEPEAARHYLAFAGGAGITPILSMLKAVLEGEPKSHFTLIYANRAVSTIMFREELEDLKNLHMGRFTLLHVLENDTQEIELFSGRLDAERCAGLLRHWVDAESADRILLCGPPPMMTEVRNALKARGISETRIRSELFRPDQPGRAPRPAPTRGGQAVRVQAQVTLDGTRRSFEIPAGMSVLEAALENGLDVPFSCKAGVCASCRARLTEGRLDMIANHALEDYEIEAGYVLTCQCYPLSERITLDYDR